MDARLQHARHGVVGPHCPGRDSLPYLMLMLRSSNADSREDAAGTLGWLGKDSDGRENLSDYLVATRINPYEEK